MVFVIYKECQYNMASIEKNISILQYIKWKKYAQAFLAEAKKAVSDAAKEISKTITKKIKDAFGNFVRKQNVSMETKEQIHIPPDKRSVKNLKTC